MRSTSKEESAGGGRAKGKKKPLPLRYPCFWRAIELHGMAHDDKSITTSFSLSSHHIGLISFLRLVFASRLSSRLGRLAIASRFLPHSSSFSFVPRNRSSIYP